MNRRSGWAECGRRANSTIRAKVAQVELGEVLDCESTEECACFGLLFGEVRRSPFLELLSGQVRLLPPLMQPSWEVRRRQFLDQVQGQLEKEP